MVLRTAGRGSRSGQQFYGCSRYPSCRGIRNIDSSDEEPVAPTPFGASYEAPSQQWTIPRPVGMRASLSTNQVVAFQSNQQVASIINAAYDEQIDKSVLALCSQWRLDFPRQNPQNTSVASTEHDTLPSIVEKLLTRGTFSYTTPEIEDFILSCTGRDLLANETLEPALQAITANPTCPYVPSSFDSPEEEQFQDYLVDKAGTEWCLLEQVDFNALLGPTGDGRNRRVDFLLTRSDGVAAVIEIDGTQHSESKRDDAVRDRELTSAGVRVFRIPTDEVRTGSGSGLDALDDFMAHPTATSLPDDNLTRAIRLGKLTHQIQVSVMKALLYGWLPLDSAWKISIYPPVSYLAPALVIEAAQVAIENCADTVQRILKLYGAPNSTIDVTAGSAGDIADANIAISFDHEAAQFSTTPVFQISDICFPNTIAAPWTTAKPIDARNPQKGEVEYFLNYIFRKDTFLEGQWETIERTLQGLDSIVLLPTGGGKSIAFQLSALLRPGCCIVVDPLIALIEDQIDNLGKVGIDRCLEITGQVDQNTRNEEQVMMGQGHYLFIYVAPERFQIDGFRQALRALVASGMPVSQVAIDEAHCVSEWGHDFRTAYLNLNRNAREYCTTPGYVSPPLVALTGTASRMVLKDMQRDLGIHGDFNATITPKTFNREELHFLSVKAKTSETIDLLKGTVESLPPKFHRSRSSFFDPCGLDTHSGIIFTATVNGYRGTTAVAKELAPSLPTKLEMYSGTPPSGIDKGRWNDIKKAASKSFKHNDIPLLIATKAYGMGIDKPNVRYTVHFGLPDSIEAFYQEAGRAGRNRNYAFCAIIFSDDDPHRSQDLLVGESSTETIERTIDSIPLRQQDDVLQALWLHIQSFKGIENENARLANIIQQLGKIGEGGEAIVRWKGDSDAQTTEKALHRLVILGIIRDYTTSYSKREFQIDLARLDSEDIALNLRKYVGGFQIALADGLYNDLRRLPENPIRDFAIAAGKRLIEFVYDHVEKSRRRAIYEMLEAARDAASSRNSDETLRARVLRHLEWSEFDAPLDAMVNSPRGGLDCVGDVLEQVEGPTDADALRGAVARRLQSVPDQPGLLIMRGISEALTRNANMDVAYQSVQSALTYATTTYRIETDVIVDALSRAIDATVGKQNAGSVIVKAITEHDSVRTSAGRTWIRFLTQSTPYPLNIPLVALLTRQLSLSTEDIHRAHDDKQQ